MIVDLATAADIAQVRADVAAVLQRLDRIEQALPPRMVSMRVAAEALGVDVQTVGNMLDRGDLVGRRAGRRITDCLEAFDKASRAREKWYGKAPSPGGKVTELTEPVERDIVCGPAYPDGSHCPIPKS